MNCMSLKINTSKKLIPHLNCKKNLMGKDAKINNK